jgi:hypothetical protein
MKEFLDFVKWCFRNENAGFVAVFIGVPVFLATIGMITCCISSVFESIAKLIIAIVKK